VSTAAVAQEGAGGACQDDALFQQAPCGYLTTTDDGTLTRANDTFLDWAGYRREDLLGTSITRLLPVGDRILYSTHCLPQLLTVGAVSEVVVEVVAADRARRACLLTATRSPASAAGPAEIRIIVFSIPERRAYEQELVAALHRAEQSESARTRAEEDLRRQAVRDALTGLPNRAGLDAELTRSLAAASAPVGLLFVDLDHFAAVNASLGTAAGDELLVVVAGRLLECARASATVARLSGDEFVVADELDTAAAEALAQRVLAALSVPVVVQGLEIVASASIGAAVSAGAEDTAERLLHHAAVAVHRAKARGRRCVAVHDPTRTDAAVGRLRLLGELRRAIAGGELRLHYQPRIGLAAGTMTGVEALVRWEHPVRGLLPPSEFIDVAEESGLVRELGAWVLDTAVEQAARWAADPAARTVQMAVNVSTRQLGDPGLVAAVTGVLARHGLDPRMLVLEVTETALMTDPDAAASALRALKELGVGVAVDDFGTGYASLTYLQRFPVDELKIDRSFVMGLGVDDGAGAIVATCVQLAHAMGIRAVAEGVETEDQRLALVAMRCDFVQGYHYARPLTAPALQAWHRERTTG